jgi:hypothetical protein
MKNPNLLGEQTIKHDIVVAMAKIYAIVHELFQCSNHGLKRKKSDKLSSFMEIMQDIMHACLANSDRERAARINDRMGKTVVLPPEKMLRKYCEGGGKAWRHDGDDVRVDQCPRCGLKKLFDKEPEYDDNKAHNDREDERFVGEQEHIREYNAQERTDPLLDKNGKPMKRGENPKYKPTLFHCHQSQNYESITGTGQKCYFGCKYDGKQYPPGTCPSCKSSCSYVWDRKDHGDKMEYFRLRRLANTTSQSERDEANRYLDNMRGEENRVMGMMQSDLQEMDDEGLVDLTDKQIDEAAQDRASFAAANFIVHNPVGVGGATFFQNVMAQGSHKNGYHWSNTLNKDMRKYGAKHEASSQRSANTRIDPLIARTVGGVYDGSGGAAAGACADAAAASESSMLDELAQMSDEERYQLAIRRSLEQQTRGSIHNNPVDFDVNNHDLSGYTDDRFNINTNNNSMESSISFNNDSSRSKSISPMPSIATKSFASTCPTNNTATQPSTTPEHVSKSRQSLLDLSMGLLDDTVSDDEVDDDATAAFDAFDDTSNPTHNTLRQTSKHLHARNVTPRKRAKKLVAVYKSLSKKKNI